MSWLDLTGYLLSLTLKKIHPDTFGTDKLIFVIGGSEDGEKTKSVRAIETQDAGGDDAGDLDQRDRLEDENEETTKVPPGFLSPSVREYLELGRSIPGTV